ncbi:uncharacterized protein LOC121735498 [Aricia agestis]|uniref:uncharacterized protein LOC121735498 n=1 Tax=Aricia agestis TaxID=91739 RepID=UPI001C209C03|nr:uncharacterized protein LOC121735498 [Aricia agestis]
MEEKKRQRCTYVIARQKKKLIELMAKHPELITCKVTQDFSYKDSQKLWQNIAKECNAIPGARKTWKQWRKTWHDIRSKSKKKQALTIRDQQIETTLTPAEKEALGLKSISPSFEYEDATEYLMIPDGNHELPIEQQSTASLSEPDSLVDSKVFEFSEHKKRKVKMKNGQKSKHSDCAINCELLAVQEKRKIQIKEDYLTFKKDYLRQKLLLLKEQTEALKNIAKELCK